MPSAGFRVRIFLVLDRAEQVDFGAAWPICQLFAKFGSQLVRFSKHGAKPAATFGAQNAKHCANLAIPPACIDEMRSIDIDRANCG